MTRIGYWVDGVQYRRDMTPDELAEYDRPQEPDRTAMHLTFRQLMIGLVGEGIITEAEGDAWQLGTLPAAVMAVIATLPQPMRYPARTSARKATTISRLDPLVIALAGAAGMADDALDAFFLGYAAI